MTVLLRFVVDAQLPPALALRAKGHEAFALREIQLRDADDDEIWERARADGAIIITKDEDFAKLVAANDEGPRVLWVRTGNLLKRVLLTRFESAWPDRSGRSSHCGRTSGRDALGTTMNKPHRIYSMSVASVYPHYVAKAEKKGRTRAELDQIIRWLTGYTQAKLDAHLTKKTTFEDFFAAAPKLNPSRALITGVICGVRIEEIEDPLMREIRYLDKLVDELAKGRPMEKILRAP